MAMAGVKGRKRRDRDGEKVLFANVDGDIIERLDAGAAVLGWSRAAYLEEFIRRSQVDEFGLPSWVHDEVGQDQLPLRLAALANRQMQEESTTNAA
jgi:hypothetical protein